jgi:hypothetical protein
LGSPLCILCCGLSTDVLARSKECALVREHVQDNRICACNRLEFWPEADGFFAAQFAPESVKLRLRLEKLTQDQGVFGAQIVIVELKYRRSGRNEIAGTRQYRHDSTTIRVLHNLTTRFHFDDTGSDHGTRNLGQRRPSCKAAQADRDGEVPGDKGLT